MIFKLKERKDCMNYGHEIKSLHEKSIDCNKKIGLRIGRRSNNQNKKNFTELPNRIITNKRRRKGKYTDYDKIEVYRNNDCSEDQIAVKYRIVSRGANGNQQNDNMAKRADDRYWKKYTNGNQKISNGTRTVEKITNDVDKNGFINAVNKRSLADPFWSPIAGCNQLSRSYLDKLRPILNLRTYISSTR